LRFLSSPQLIDELEVDYTELGYVREQKNKILLYLVMTSRLMDNPLHSIVISRSGAGKSILVEITEQLCPPEDLHSVSDLTSQALYYFGQDDLKHKFTVVGEKEGTEGSDYPLRELISKKSITKAIPMKDPTSGQIKTVSITVNGTQGCLLERFEKA
jgi:DNA primase